MLCGVVYNNPIPHINVPWYAPELYMLIASERIYVDFQHSKMLHICFIEDVWATYKIIDYRPV